MINKLQQIILSTLKMDFNGCLITVDEDITLYFSELRRDKPLGDIIFNLITPKFEEIEGLKVVGYNDRLFREDSAMQTMWVVLIEGQRYLIELLLKWYVNNLLVAEFNIITISEQEIQNYALKGLLDHVCRFNYSKIVHSFDMIRIPDTTRSVPSLISNKITDIPKLIEETGGLVENLDKI